MRAISCCAALLAVGAVIAITQADAQDRGGGGVIPQNIPPAVAQNPSVPPLALSPAQRTKIQQAVRSEDTEVSFALKGAKSAQNFEPSIGAKVPGALKLHTLTITALGKNTSWGTDIESRNVLFLPR
jgi:hypothetical protein